MPRLPTITAKKFIKAIKKSGFEFHRIVGSHHIYVNPSTRQTISIPMHAGRDLGRGLVKSLLKQAGISETEFRQLL